MMKYTIEDLFFVPLEREGNEFVQTFQLSMEELPDYHSDSFSSIINEYYHRIEATVRLFTGKFTIPVYEPKDSANEVFFCLVNKENYPSNQQKTSITENYLAELRKVLSKNIQKTEGIVSDQAILIQSDFVTPSYCINKKTETKYYHSGHFKKDFIILGPPGSGKTTLLKKLAIDILNTSLERDLALLTIPLFIQLRTYNYFEGSFETYIENIIKNTFSEYHYLPEDIRETGNLLLLLDGIDEVDFEKYHQFKTTIKSYKLKNPKVSFGFTCRQDYSLLPLLDIDYFEMMPFNHHQIEELTYKKLCRHGKWKDFLSITNETPDIIDILRNPLLLTFSHFLFLHKSILPLNRGQLLKELVDTLVTNWDAQRNIQRKFNDRIVNPAIITYVLGKIAFDFTEKKKHRSKIEETYSLFTNYESLDDFRRTIQYIEFATGLIIERNNSEIEFVHKTFQDFFCSNYLVERVGELNKELYDQSEWEKILSIISGLSSEPSYIIEKLLNKKEKHIESKILESLTIYNESVLMSKRDIKGTVKLMEDFFINYEKNQMIIVNTSNLKNKEIVIEGSFDQHFVSKLSAIFREIYKIRFTRYENDFYTSLKKSKSVILAAIPQIALKKGMIIINQLQNGISLSFKEQSPDIYDWE